MTEANAKKHTPWLIWPIKLSWRATTLISNRIGILATLGIGGVLLILGFFLTGSIIGALIGIPMLAAGTLFLARGLY
jgi:hypothetical protein